MGQTPRRKTLRRPEPDAFSKLIETSAFLQAPRGCPWDRAQTVRSLLPCMIEEAWEVFEAVHRADPSEDLEEELGDLFYTVLFMAMRGEHDGILSVSRMFERTREKMIRRHPHVFGKRKAKTAGEAYGRWQEIKRSEKKRRRGPSKRFSRLLVRLWDYLLEDKTAETRAGTLVRGRRPSRRRLPLQSLSEK